MRRADPYETRARELAVAAGLDPNARVERPGQRSMPVWCTYRDAARAEHVASEAAATAADIAITPQAAEFQDSPLKVFGEHDENTLAQMRGQERAKQKPSACHDCNRPYGHEHGFPDFIIPYDAWRRISPTGGDGGLLCPSCICQRLHNAGIKCTGAFMSGPIVSVSEPTMNALRRIENIELAIGGRDNRWAGVRDLVAVPNNTGGADNG